MPFACCCCFVVVAGVAVVAVIVVAGVAVLVAAAVCIPSSSDHLGALYKNKDGNRMQNRTEPRMRIMLHSDWARPCLCDAWLAESPQRCHL